MLVLLLDFLRGDNDAFHGDVAQLGDEQLAGHVVFKLRDGHVLLGEHRGIGVFAGEFAILKELGNRLADAVGEVFVGDLEAQPLGFVGHGALGDHGVDELGDIVRHQLGGHLAAAHIHLNHLLDIGQRDRFLADFGDHLIVTRCCRPGCSWAPGRST